MGRGKRRKEGRQREPGTLFALLYLPHHRQRRGTEAATEHCQGVSPMEQSLIH